MLRITFYATMAAILTVGAAFAQTDKPYVPGMPGIGILCALTNKG